MYSNFSTKSDTICFLPTTFINIFKIYYKYFSTKWHPNNTMKCITSKVYFYNFYDLYLIKFFILFFLRVSRVLSTVTTAIRDTVGNAVDTVNEFIERHLRL